MTKTSTPNFRPGPGAHPKMFDLNTERAAWMQAWSEFLGVETPEVEADEPRHQSGEQHEKSPEAKRQYAEALAYIESYRGSWGLILDLRADSRWGTKWFRLSERQVEVILNAKQRDAERATVVSTHPRYAEAVAYATANRQGNDFLTSIAEQATRRTLSDKQVDAVLRGKDRQQGSSSPAARVEVTEGWYMVEDQPWKVQVAVNGSGRLYAKRLTDEGWEYVSGGLKVIAKDGVPMTLEMAQQYGRLYGVCGVCGRTLTDETSIAAGIGPICAGRLG